MKTRPPFLLSGLFLAALLGWACGKNGGSPTSPPPPPTSNVTSSNVILAMFLGEGPLRPASGLTCDTSGSWRGYPRGSRLHIRLSTALSGAERSNVEGFLAGLSGLIGGAYELAIETTNEENPIPGFLEVTATSLSNPQIDAFCNPGAGGCAKFTFQAPSILASSRTASRHGLGGNVHNHELGHGILGLCHLDGAQMPDALMATPNSAATSNFNSLERQVIQAVMRSGLSAGASRADFERAGLVQPAGTSGASSSPGLGAPGAVDAPPILRPNRRERGGAAERERQ